MRRFYLSLVAIFACWVHPPIADAKSEGPAVGSEAPDFKARNVVSGATTTLNSQRGKVVILTFWASWCGPCRRELPLLERAQELVGKDSLTVLAVSFNENPEAASAIKRQAAAWRIKRCSQTIWATVIERFKNSSMTSIMPWLRRTVRMTRHRSPRPGNRGAARGCPAAAQPSRRGHELRIVLE
jgi:thiol-disulfide isomerase/thioredoxin